MNFTQRSRAMRPLAIGAVLAACILASQSGLAQQHRGGREHWVGTWATASVLRPLPSSSPVAGQTQQAASAPAAPSAPILNFSNQTLRQIVRSSLGGSRVRVVFSNAFGTATLVIGAAHIGLRENGASIASKSGRSLGFDGRPGATIPAGAVLLSDPVDLTFAPLADLAIDMYLPGDTAASPSPVTHHGGTGALQTNYVSTPGNHVGEASLSVETTTLIWHFLARVEVVAPTGAGAVVTLGDSITDGSRSTPDTNNRWPNHLARHLTDRKMRMGVLNVGIGGNRLLRDGNGASGLSRFDRDVVAQTGATHLVVMIGINDLSSLQGPPATSTDLIAAHRQVIERARARGLIIYGATLTPCEGVTIPGYWTPEGEAERQAFNQWIRTSGAYDGVIDFDVLLRDPSHLGRLLPKYASIDNLHPNDAGYERMGNAVSLELFKRAGSAVGTGR